jgi:uncharacterized Zn finger protein
MPFDRTGWYPYPPSVPRPVVGGLATSKQRGRPMAEAWWSKRFTSVLESYGLGGRMQRGRRYARQGQVLDLGVGSGVIASHVQGSRVKPYVVTISLKAPTAAQWEKIDDVIAAKVGFAARLLAGDVPPELEAVFADAGVPLFPTRWRDLKTDCTCPDRENPCKHIAAVLYVFADQLDTDPWLVLEWRGRSREQILEQFGSAADADASTHEEVAPWWPFPPGPSQLLHEGAAIADTGVVAPDPPDAVLDALEPLDVSIGADSIVERIRPLYAHVIEPPVD